MRFFSTKLLRSNPLEKNWNIYDVGTYNHNSRDYITQFGAIQYIDDRIIAVGGTESSSECAIWVADSVDKFPRYPAITFDTNEFLSCHSIAYKYDENSNYKYTYVIGCNNCVVVTHDFVDYDVYSLSFTCNKLIYANGKFVAVGDFGKIYTSTDGITWTSRTSNVSIPLYSITYINNMYIVGGASGVILTSTNGTTWTRKTNIDEPNSYIREIYSFNNKYISIMRNGNIYESTDLDSWTQKSSNSVINIFDFCNVFFGCDYRTFKLIDGDNFASITEKQFFEFNSNEFFTVATIIEDSILICTNKGKIYTRDLSDYKTQGDEDV